MTRPPVWRPVGQPKETGVPAKVYSCEHCADAKSAQWWARRVPRTQFRAAYEALVCDGCRQCEVAGT